MCSSSHTTSPTPNDSDAVPILGSVAVGMVLLTGLGAVLLTYVGLKEFSPVSIPD